jgi:hypothetical protein
MREYRPDGAGWASASLNHHKNTKAQSDLLMLLER